MDVGEGETTVGVGTARLTEGREYVARATPVVTTTTASYKIDRSLNNEENWGEVSTNHLKSSVPFVREEIAHTHSNTQALPDILVQS